VARSREGVQVRAMGPGECGDRSGGGCRDAASVEAGQYVPACLVDLLVQPGPFPVADDAGPGDTPSRPPAISLQDSKSRRERKAVGKLS
jgi:hypothetical protein